MKSPTRTLIVSAAFAATSANGQEPATPAGPEVTVTATRVERESIDLPLSIDSVNATTIREDRPQVNLSESLNAVPGIVVQNRQNYAQDLQISSRGFGARTPFGVRGLRLIADGIPATMPDGQGQAASFNLDTAERIEVLRGPFASMYGNASGGVIQIFTADGPPQPTFGARLNAGSYDTRKWTAQYGGQHGPLNINAAASRFRTEGYREHSAARRDHAHGKFKLDGGSAGVFTFIGDALDQPETQDPQGLTAAQVAHNPRQASTNARAFNTRKSITQNQVGLLHDFRISGADALQTRVYAGDRQVTQYLGFAGAGATASGGVVDLDRGYGGAGIRWSRSLIAHGTPLDLHLGFDYERMAERRRGYVNNAGIAGALSRDEDNVVQSADVYAQVEWRLHDRFLLLAGVRHSRVRFESKDNFIVTNADDSGAVRYVRTSPVAGITYDVSPALKVYANIGKGFETPTFAELAYRPDPTTSGLNFALRPSVSTHREIGAKMLLGRNARATVALFDIDVTDEIVVAGAVLPGRTTFRNAAETQRKGIEVGWQGQLGAGFESALAYSLLDARFAKPFTSGAVTVPADNRLPGVPSSTFYGELIWRHAATGFHAGVELRHNGRVYVDDQNSQSAASYTVGNARIGFEQRRRSWRFSEFVRVDNITDKRYIGSVIVAAAGGAFYEPAPGRNWLAGVSAEVVF